MSLEQVIALQTAEGHDYLIKFSQFKNVDLPNGINIEIVDVVIARLTDAGRNNASTLFAICNLIKEYLETNDVVLYCYCDQKEIDRSVKRQGMLPQEFRSELFSTLFHKCSNTNYTNTKIIIADNDNGDHYIHLIAHNNNAAQVDTIAAQLRRFHK